MSDVIKAVYKLSFAGAYILLAFAGFFLLYWVELPDKNKEIVYFIAGIIYSEIQGMIKHFFDHKKSENDDGEKANTNLPGNNKP